MKLDQLLREAALERPGVGMPESVMQMVREGWVPAIDEYLDQDDSTWSFWFLLLYHFFQSGDHLSSRRAASPWSDRVSHGSATSRHVL
jgi:hypothetical protein